MTNVNPFVVVFLLDRYKYQGLAFWSLVVGKRRIKMNLHYKEAFISKKFIVNLLLEPIIPFVIITLTNESFEIALN